MVTPPDPTPSVRLVSNAGLAERLELWASEARIDEAALQRSRARWLSETADQEAHLGGVLLDLGERGSTAVFRLRGGRMPSGRVEVSGADFVAVRTVHDVVLLPHEAITLVRTSPADDEVVGGRPLATDVRLHDVLRELAGDREHVRLALADGGDALGGELRRVGVDVLALRVAGAPPSTVHVPLAAVVEVALG